jgi:hypothetical protein
MWTLSQRSFFPGVLVTLLIAGTCLGQNLPHDRSVGNLEVVATFNQGPMPTGITVSRTGRIFLNYPYWGDPSDFAVAE